MEGEGFVAEVEEEDPEEFRHRDRKDHSPAQDADEEHEGRDDEVESDPVHHAPERANAECVLPVLVLVEIVQVRRSSRSDSLLARRPRRLVLAGSTVPRRSTGKEPRVLALSSSDDGEGLARDDSKRSLAGRRRGSFVVAPARLVGQVGLRSLAGPKLVDHRRSRPERSSTRRQRRPIVRLPRSTPSVRLASILDVVVPQRLAHVVLVLLILLLDVLPDIVVLLARKVIAPALDVLAERPNEVPAELVDDAPVLAAAPGNAPQDGADDEADEVEPDAEDEGPEDVAGSEVAKSGGGGSGVEGGFGVAGDGARLLVEGGFPYRETEGMLDVDGLLSKKLVEHAKKAKEEGD